MHTSSIWLQVVLVVGLVAMLVGAVDPLEGSFLILAGVGLVALAAAIGGGRHRRLLYGSFALVAIGVAAMVVLSWLGGIGGNSGRSLWWAIILLPLPVGWILGLVGAIGTLVECFKHPGPPKHAVQ